MMSPDLREWNLQSEANKSMKDVPTIFWCFSISRDAMVVIVSDIITYKDVFNNDDDGESFSLKKKLYGSLNLPFPYLPVPCKPILVKCWSAQSQHEMYGVEICTFDLFFYLYIFCNL